jgi:hypothetical protein
VADRLRIDAHATWRATPIPGGDEASMNQNKLETPTAEKVDLKLRRRVTPGVALKTGVRAGHAQVTPL